MKLHYEADAKMKKQMELLYNFMKAHKLAVISTVNGECLPESAVIGFAVKENLEILCSSFTTSRKYQNIQKNPRVALVIGWEDGKTVQYEGLAEEITDQGSEELLENQLSSVPSIAKYLEREHQAFYTIKPRWIRFSDLSVDPWDRFEVTFES